MRRREFLIAGAASTLAAPAVHAQARKFAGVTLRCNGYGGTYDKTLIDFVAKPLEERTGLKVEYYAGNTSVDMVKLLSNKGNPHIDLLMSDSPFMPEATGNGLIEPVTAADVPNLSHVLPAFREFGEFGAPFSVASMIPVYNSDTVKQPLTAYADIARPDLKGKCAMFAPSLSAAFLALLALAEGAGGSVTDMTPGLKVLAAAKENIVAVANSTVAELQLFRQGEVQAGLFWDSRATELRRTGTPVQTVVPREGIYAVTSYISPVKGGRNKEAAFAYIDALLSADGMLGLPKQMGLAPTTDVPLGDLAPNILFNSPERAAMKRKVDWAALMQQRGALTEQMNKVLQG